MIKSSFILFPLFSLIIILFLVNPLKVSDKLNLIFPDSPKEVKSFISAENEPIIKVDRARLLRLINNLRSTGRYCGSNYEQPSAPLVWSNKLEKAARLHSLDMYRNNYLSHESKDGVPFYVRIKRQSYNYITCAENIALGHETEEAVLAGWTKSEGHCRNFMNDLYSEIGIARTGNYWVMVLAYPDNFVQ